MEILNLYVNALKIPAKVVMRGNRVFVSVNPVSRETL